jgi:DNA-binding PadR family transcriptional regulator
MGNGRQPSLTPTSYIVLGLLELYGEGTPYDLKAWAAASIGNFWSVPHSALYAEPERLAGGGYLVERREAFGRRRKLYDLTTEGRQALEAWRHAPTEGLPELRDPGLLKLFFGAEVGPLAKARREAHARKLAEYEARAATPDDPNAPPGSRLTLDAGIGHEREWVRFWSRLASDAVD